MDHFQPASVSCDTFGKCTDRESRNMRYPMDTKSMYADRYYDKQTGGARCYERNPIEIVEGFGAFNFNKVLLWAIIAIIVYLLYTMYFAKEEITVGVQSAGVPVSELNPGFTAPY
jgi:hypothetical protein